MNCKNIIKTVLVNSDAANMGKTSTIKGIYERLEEKYHLEQLKPIIDGGEISARFKIDGIIFGLESQGDPNSRIFKSLEEFVKCECDIIIVACRTRGATRE